MYVRLESGKELLFIGDVAWHMDQLRELWYRPRLVTDLFIHENRDQVLAEFRTLHDLAEKEPALVIVVSHDVDERKDLIAKGVLWRPLRVPAHVIARSRVTRPANTPACWWALQPVRLSGRLSEKGLQVALLRIVVGLADEHVLGVVRDGHRLAHRVRCGWGARRAHTSRDGTSHLLRASARRRSPARRAPQSTCRKPLGIRPR